MLDMLGIGIGPIPILLAFPFENRMIIFIISIVYSSTHFRLLMNSLCDKCHNDLNFRSQKGVDKKTLPDIIPRSLDLELSCP